jgi:HPt (histidine-containing phosphotransfer) domain-containing protein
MARSTAATAIPFETATLHGADRRIANARPVDLVHLALQTLGNKDLETEVLGLFLRQSTIQIARIGSAPSPRDQFEAAHKLKGSARAIGAARVAECAEDVEIAAERGGDIAAPLAELARAVTIANSFITALID